MKLAGESKYNINDIVSWKTPKFGETEFRYGRITNIIMSLKTYVCGEDTGISFDYVIDDGDDLHECEIVKVVGFDDTEPGQ